jgi:hypothetical protein
VGLKGKNLEVIEESEEFLDDPVNQIALVQDIVSTTIASMRSLREGEGAPKIGNDHRSVEALNPKDPVATTSTKKDSVEAPQVTGLDLVLGHGAEGFCRWVHNVT